MCKDGNTSILDLIGAKQRSVQTTSGWQRFDWPFSRFSLSIRQQILFRFRFHVFLFNHFRYERADHHFLSGRHTGGRDRGGVWKGRWRGRSWWFLGGSLRYVNRGAVSLCYNCFEHRWNARRVVGRNVVHDRKLIQVLSRVFHVRWDFNRMDGRMFTFFIVSDIQSFALKQNYFITIWEREKEREMFYLTTHSTHFIYGYMASDIWLRTILILREETRCRHIG